MPTWEETKRNMQMAFLDTAKDIHSSIGNAYQQIMTTGHIYPPMGRGENFTQQIAMGNFGHGEINPEYSSMDKFYQAQEEERERNEAILKEFEPEDGIEPDR